MRFGFFQQDRQSVGVQAAQDVNLATRQQGAVKLERRILRRRAHQRHRAGFHERQKSVLLRAIEAVDFVDEQQGRLARDTPRRRRIERLAQIRDAGKHCRKLLKLVARGLRQQSRNGGLARARRSPQDHRRQPPRRRHPPDRTLRPQQMILAHDLAQRLRPQPVGQRPRRLRRQAGGFEEIVHGAETSRVEADRHIRSASAPPLSSEPGRDHLLAALNVQHPAARA